MITNNKNRENHWLDSDKELIEFINYQLMVSGAKKPHLTHNLNCVRWDFLFSSFLCFV